MLSESQFDESDLATHRLGDGQMTRPCNIAHRIYGGNHESPVGGSLVLWKPLWSNRTSSRRNFVLGTQLQR